MTIRVHLGSAGARLDGWLNVDGDPRAAADAYADPFDFVARNGPDIGELYLGRLLEALSLDDARALLHLIASRTSPGTLVTAGASDIRAVATAFAAGEMTTEQLNRQFVHAGSGGAELRSSWDAASLLELFKAAGLQSVTAVNPATLPDAREVGPDQLRWRCAVSGVVSGTARPDADGAAPNTSPGKPRAAKPQPASTPEAALLAELQTLRAELERSRARERDALPRAAKADTLAEELEAVTGSITFRVAHRGSLVARRVLPKGSRRRRLVAGALRSLRRSSRDAKGDES